jgi:regulator of protease activity HflC (stomatin/prohibitin superfamily)
VAPTRLIKATVKILREYERAVVFTLGRFQKVKGPGLVLLIPFLQEMVRVDLRIQVIEIPSQDVISRDNVSMKVDAVLYFNVVNPERAIIQVQNYLPATNMLAQTTLRAVLGSARARRDALRTQEAQRRRAEHSGRATETWGIKVSNVEIRTVELTDNMVRAIAKQAEAERDRRAKIIHAEAEFQASQTLVNAAKILGSVPAAMQLALPPDADGNRRRTEFHRRLSDADRHHEAVPGSAREVEQAARRQRALARLGSQVGNRVGRNRNS